MRLEFVYRSHVCPVEDIQGSFGWVNDPSIRYAHCDEVFLEFPTDIVFQVVLFRLRYKLSLRDVPEMFLLRGFEFTHEAVREWEERFAPLLAEQLRRKRKGKVGSALVRRRNIPEGQRQMVLLVSCD